MYATALCQPLAICDRDINSNINITVYIYQIEYKYIHHYLH